MCHQLAARGLPNYNINNANWRHFHSVCFVCTREATKRYRRWCLFSGWSSVVMRVKSVTFLHLVAAAHSLTRLSFVSSRSKERERRQAAERRTE